jgi:hypothetical protein
MDGLIEFKIVKIEYNTICKREETREIAFDLLAEASCFLNKITLFYYGYDASFFGMTNPLFHCHAEE